MKFGKTARLLSMLGVTFSFFLVEIIVGYVTHSMALIADSFHMLSDVMALLVAFLSVRISKRKSSKNTFGWARAEVLGALVNSVFLLALCFSIFVEAIERFHMEVKIEDPKLVLIVGCLGLAVNLIGLLLFHQHTHSHGDGHSGINHGDKGQHDHEAHTVKKAGRDRKKCDDIKCAETDGTVPEAVHLVNQEEHAHNGPTGLDAALEEPLPEPRIASSSQLNMRGVFLHVLGDALGSVVVIISALIIWHTDFQYKHYIDPAMSIVMVCIISYTTIPLLKESAMILMQTVPTHIEIEDIKSRLLKIDGVLAVHELHIWQLAGDRIIASAHIRCHNLQEYMRVAVKIKRFFHCEGIHSTTMQPEFEEPPMDGAGTEDDIVRSTMSTCILPCPADNKSCATSVCCIKNGPVAVITKSGSGDDMVMRARMLENVLNSESRSGTEENRRVTPDRPPSLTLSDGNWSPAPQ
ncbi:uncharacterized protein LOC129580717 [Paramacrobiotus metropolitanus]|uniref:uncharacterized protein LOC129580717 n=1 Tax=Paramacrobiotus metropolitanus TaxID=2943436 RepID=UPI002445D417|nr:uncharacterized protein LOC129580717 [Paramacrobiotus metropolitanus]